MAYTEKELAEIGRKTVETRKKAYTRRAARLALYEQKAKAAKMSVSEAEIEAYLKTKKK